MAESKLKYEKAMMTSDEIAEKIFNLISESDILQDILNDQEEELPIAYRRSEELLEVGDKILALSCCLRHNFSTYNRPHLSLKLGAQNE